MVASQRGTMNVKSFVAVGIAMLIGGYLLAKPAFAMNCEQDSISDVSGSGSILEMLSGAIYKG
jgi:hypothetical protein